MTSNSFFKLHFLPRGFMFLISSFICLFLVIDLAISTSTINSDDEIYTNKIGSFTRIPRGNLTTLSMSALKIKSKRTCVDDLWMLYNTNIQMLGPLPYFDASMSERDKLKAVNLMIKERIKYPEDLIV